MEPHLLCYSENKKLIVQLLIRKGGKENPYVSIKGVVTKSQWDTPGRRSWHTDEEPLFATVFGTFAEAVEARRYYSLPSFIIPRPLTTDERKLHYNNGAGDAL